MDPIWDLIDPAELSGVARALLLEDPAVQRMNLNRFLPDVVRDDIDFAYTVGGRDATSAATFRAFDTESPIASRPGFSERRGSLPPLSEKIQLKERERLLLNSLGGGTNERLINAVYDDVRRLARKLFARLEMARGEALTTGAITIAERGLQLEVDYGVDASHLITAPALWSEPTTDILGQLLTWVQLYSDDSDGVLPERMLISRRARGFMLANERIAQLAGRSTDVPAPVDVATLNEVLGRYDVPPVEVYDVQLRDYAGTTQRVLPDTDVVFVPPADTPVGTTQHGITAEALELAGDPSSQFEAATAPGVVVHTWQEHNPVARWTNAVDLALPIITNPELVFRATVLDPA